MGYNIEIEEVKNIIKYVFKDECNITNKHIIYEFFKDCLSESLIDDYPEEVFKCFLSIIGDHLIDNREKEFIEYLKDTSIRFSSNQFNTFAILRTILDEINERIKNDKKDEE